MVARAFLCPKGDGMPKNRIEKQYETEEEMELDYDSMREDGWHMKHNYHDVDGTWIAVYVR